MEYEKDFGSKFSFGYGTSATAGAGRLSDAEIKSNKTNIRHIKRTAVKTVFKAAAAALLVASALKKKK